MKSSLLSNSVTNRFWRRLNILERRYSRVGTLAALVLSIAAVAAGVATYAALTETPPFGNDPRTIFWLLNLDLVILLVLATLIGRRIAGLWSGRRRGVPGARLHGRLVMIFSLLAAIPAIIMAVFSAVFFYYGVQGWFSEKVQNAVTQSQAFAEAYMEEHQQVVRADILAMASDLDRAADMAAHNPAGFDQLVQTQSFLRNLSEVLIFDGSGRVVASSGMNFSLQFENIPQYVMDQARQGEVAVMGTRDDDRVRALVQLNGFIDTYLFVGRMVDPLVRSRLDATLRAVDEYDQLEAQRGDLQIKMMMMFVVVGLLLLLAAMWFGLVLARQLVTPIGSLVNAADRVRAGDLTVRLIESDNLDEFEVLARAFNRMTSQIQDQRDELIMANRKLDQRRRFTETVLAGVSAGIIGVDRMGKITLANSSAADLFGDKDERLVSRAIGDIVPEIQPLLDLAHQKPGKITQGEIPFIDVDGNRRTFLVRIAIDLIGDEDRGAVLTFDDMTALQSAQRKAAWADVARRIAHEIKNPLTPIQLSAERLKKRYLKQITEDPDIFAQCTDTIIHHVGDIGRMVNEFSAFARMPDPVMKRENLLTLLRDTMILQQQAHPDIKFTHSGFDLRSISANPVWMEADAQQVRQVFTNILQNAIDAIETRQKNGISQGVETGAPGHVELCLHQNRGDGTVMVLVSDNGAGLPKGEDNARLTDPYVTHREKGTGLGLAIVKKIMEDHGGRLIIGTTDTIRAIPGWHDLGGATMTLVFDLATDDMMAEDENFTPLDAVSG